MTTPFDAYLAKIQADFSVSGTLSNDDITHYQRIVVALQETMRVMKQIDAAIPSWPIS